MVLIMITSWIPQGKETIVGKKYTEVMREYPGENFEKVVLPLGGSLLKKVRKLFL